MKKDIFVAVVALILVNSAAVYAASGLKVEKIVENSNVRVGDGVKISLRFENPFGEELPVKITDKNLFGSNGLDIKCLEYVIPKDKESILSYEPIKPFSSGTYEISHAEVTYLNPETKKEETVKSNSLRINVKESKLNNGQSQGITTIYRCNGINMQSTSYSFSGGSFSMQIGGSNIKSPQGQNKKSGPSSPIQNNQLNQDSNALKRQLERQLEKQRKAEEEFKKNLWQNKTFLKKHQKILNLGYNLTNASFNVISKDSGSFEFSYKKEGKKKARLKGVMENSSIKEIMSLTYEDKQLILKKLSENSDFKKYDKKLKSGGFSRADVIFNQIGQNFTKVQVQYKKGKKESIITADYVNFSIGNVQLENFEEDKINLWLVFLLFILALLLWIFYKKYFEMLRKIRGRIKDKSKVITLESKNSVDYKKAAREMIREAKRLFRDGREKDAFERIAQAVRFYFSNSIGIKKELSNQELITLLKENKIKSHLEVLRCLNLCSLVEFARYKPSKSDFEKAFQIAEKVIG